MVASLFSGVQTIQVSALSDEWYEGVYMNQSHSFSVRVFFFQGETEQEAQSYFSISVPFCPELNTPFEHRPGLLGTNRWAGQVWLWLSTLSMDALILRRLSGQGDEGVETRTMPRRERYRQGRSDQTYLKSGGPRYSDL